MHQKVTQPTPHRGGNVKKYSAALPRAGAPEAPPSGFAGGLVRDKRGLQCGIVRGRPATGAPQTPEY
jgi:hypothetical protein